MNNLNDVFIAQRNQMIDEYVANNATVVPNIYYL